ncbi:YheT family hydrolase [Nafulsella turpanensis]|uniref:YheT family hydrolase n=1 Tax=Nafulsella turpanensis TaxID=1265690 RepID=UPI000477E355|nr:alpha/beta fold hydrolase [Nafulsella turpanensis]
MNTPAYQPPFYQFNGHLQTIMPSLFRKVKNVHYERERIYTADEDFLDLDWLRKGSSDTLLIVSHGLEGDSHRSYVKGMVRAFARRGCHALAWNYRGCSGEPNLQERFYHSGATEDLEAVVQHVRQLGQYKKIILSGFSLGGNLTLKYLGERGSNIAPELWKAAVFSVPLDLSGSSTQISQRSNWIYNKRFLNHLGKKIKSKAAKMPGRLDVGALRDIKTLRQFDDTYTAPLHGFINAEAYYAHCSALRYLDNIQLPTLILNAKNDPFLSDSCYPEASLKEHPFITFEAPEEGGHVGFAPAPGEELYYSEKQALEFVLG